LFDLVIKWWLGVTPDALQRIEVMLIPPVMLDLIKLMSRNKLSYTDNINRSIILYNRLDELVATGHDILLRRRRAWWHLLRPYEYLQVIWQTAE
jgi:hypothetical protein